MPAYHVIFQVRLTADVVLRTEKNRDVHMHAKKNKANGVFSLPWTAARPVFRNKRKFLHKKKGSTWPPFYCFKTPTWRTRRHVKQGTFWAHARGLNADRGNIDPYWVFISREEKLLVGLSKWIRGKLFARTMKAGMSYRKSPGFVTNLDTLVTDNEGRARWPALYAKYN